MKTVSLLLGLGLLGACADRPPAETTASDQTKLAAMLANYEQSGPPVSCVFQRDLRGNRSVGGSAIVFDGISSSTVWVNRPAGGCPPLESGQALVTHTSNGQLCRGDVATVIDPVANITYGGCGLGDFTPYRRVKR